MATRAAAFFDLDKTIIATSSLTAFTGAFLARGITTRRAILRTAYAQAAFLLGNADHEKSERLRVLITEAVAGWDVGQVKQIARETLGEVIVPKVYEEALSLIAAHQAAGRDVVIVSASGAEVVEPIAHMLGADHVLATRMTVADGRYTGEIEFYCYAENKAIAINDLATREGYDLAASYAYSDSITDTPMLQAVGHGAVVNADRALRTMAAQEGWQTLTFSHTRSLTRKVSRTAGLAIGLASLAAGSAALGYYAGRRRGGGELCGGRLLARSTREFRNTG